MGLTEKTKAATEALLQSLFPSKMQYFNAVWASCLGRVGIRRIEDAGPTTRERIWDEQASARLTDQLRSLFDRRLSYVTLIMFDSVMALQEIKKVRALDEKTLTSVIQDAIARTNASEKLAQHLMQVVPHLVASILDINLPSRAELPPLPVQSDQYYVAWRLPDGTGSKSGFRSERQIKSDILAHRSDFHLVVDERTDEILVRNKNMKGRKSAECLSVSIHALQRRHRVLLYLILSALRTRAEIPHSQIARETFGGTVELTASNIRRTLSAVNSKLHGVFKGIVEPIPGMGKYRISSEPFFYCWIRSDKHTSRLRKDRWCHEEDHGSARPVSPH